jgi:hypothetical protein
MTSLNAHQLDCIMDVSWTLDALFCDDKNLYSSGTNPGNETFEVLASVTRYSR